MKNLLRFIALFALVLPLMASAETVTGSGSVTDTSDPNNDLSFSGVLGQSTFDFSGGDGYVYTDGVTITTSDSNCQQNCSTNDGSVSITFNLTSPNPAVPGGGTVVFSGDVNGNTIHWDSTARTISFGDGWSLLIALPDLNLHGFQDSLSGSEDVTMTLVDPPVPAPEPSSLALLGTGILGAAGFVRRKLAC